jgi:hypothetical protein
MVSLISNFYIWHPSHLLSNAKPVMRPIAQLLRSHNPDNGRTGHSSFIKQPGNAHKTAPQDPETTSIGHADSGRPCGIHATA